MNIALRPYGGEQTQAMALIKNFWKCHNGAEPTHLEALDDLNQWTREGHALYLIEEDGEAVGFVHLGSRGAQCDWLEDLFVLPAFQRRGIGTRAVALAEEIVKGYSDSLYIEAAARNEGAIRLYRNLGYNCLNTITIRKDFRPEAFTCVRTELIQGREFEIRRIKEK